MSDTGNCADNPCTATDGKKSGVISVDAAPVTPRNSVLSAASTISSTEPLTPNAPEFYPQNYAAVFQNDSAPTGSFRNPLMEVQQTVSALMDRPADFDQLMAPLVQSLLTSVQDDIALNAIVSELFTQSVQQTNFHYTGARASCYLSQHLKLPFGSFLEQLVVRCQNKYSSLLQAPTSAENLSSLVGFTIFMGELLLSIKESGLDIPELPQQIAQLLLTLLAYDNCEALHYALKVLKLTGAVLEERGTDLSQIFSELERFSINSRIPESTQLMISSLIELRANNWRRREEEIAAASGTWDVKNYITAEAVIQSEKISESIQVQPDRKRKISRREKDAHATKRIVMVDHSGKQKHQQQEKKQQMEQQRERVRNAIYRLIPTSISNLRDIDKRADMGAVLIKVADDKASKEKKGEHQKDYQDRNFTLRLDAFLKEVGSFRCQVELAGGSKDLCKKKYKHISGRLRNLKKEWRDLAIENAEKYKGNRAEREYNQLRYFDDVELIMADNVFKDFHPKANPYNTDDGLQFPKAITETSELVDLVNFEIDQISAYASHLREWIVDATQPAHLNSKALCVQNGGRLNLDNLQDICEEKQGACEKFTLDRASVVHDALIQPSSFTRMQSLREFDRMMALAWRETAQEMASLCSDLVEFFVKNSEFLL